jgi:hypothetical protein
MVPRLSTFNLEEEKKNQKKYRGIKDYSHTRVYQGKNEALPRVADFV